LQIYALIYLFSQTLCVIMNKCWIIYILTSFIPGYKILKLYSLLTFSRTTFSFVLLWIVLVSLYPLRKSETFVPLTSVMSQDLALHQGTSRLQMSSANLWTFAINITFHLRTHFRLLNPTELRHYRLACIVSLPRIKFSLLLVLVLV
jgi:hypothetical protein